MKYLPFQRCFANLVRPQLPEGKGPLSSTRAPTVATSWCPPPCRPPQAPGQPLRWKAGRRGDTEGGGPPVRPVVVLVLGRALGCCSTPIGDSSHVCTGTHSSPGSEGHRGQGPGAWEWSWTSVVGGVRPPPAPLHRYLAPPAQGYGWTTPPGQQCLCPRTGEEWGTAPDGEFGWGGTSVKT